MGDTSVQLVGDDHGDRATGGEDVSEDENPGFDEMDRETLIAYVKTTGKFAPGQKRKVRPDAPPRDSRDVRRKP